MYKAIKNIIEKYDSIVIFGHINPDGDCYGAQIGLRQAIKETYPDKKVFAVGSGFKPGLDLFLPMDEVSDEIVANSLHIAVDFNTIERAEDKRLGTGLDMIMIDHHMKQAPFGSIQLIDNDSIAASQIIASFIMEMGFK